MAKWYKELENGKIRLYVAIGSREKRITKSKTIGPIKGRAREREPKINQALDLFEENVRIEMEKPAVENVADFAKNWLLLKETDVSPVTLSGYRNTMRLHILPTFGDRVLDDISALEIKEYYRKLGEKLSQIHVRDIHNVLSAFFMDAVRLGLLTQSPTQFVRAPRVAKKEQAVFREQDISKVLAAIEQEPIHHQCVFLLALFGGLRRGEICGLNWSDLNELRGYLSISRSYVAFDGKKLLKETKTNRIRSISLPMILIEKLREWFKVSSSIYVVRVDEEHRDAMFKQVDGRRIFPTTPTQWWRNFLKNNPSLPDVKFHGLRHTSASLLLANGLDIETVSRRLGHANTTTTLSTYSHIVQQKDKEINDIFSQAVKCTENVQNSGSNKKLS